MQETMERTTDDAVVGSATYATILVHAEPGPASSRRVQVAARIARNHNARLIGLGAETFDRALLTADGYGDGGAFTMVQEQISRNLRGAETAFRRDAGDADASWRSIQDYPHRALVRTAHAADLIVVSPRASRSTMQSADPADVVMNSGRPVLVVPEGSAQLVGQTVVVAWNGARECRRAVADALPFLQRAKDVIVLAIVKPDMTEAAILETDDVVANLKRHGVFARPLVTHIGHEPVETELERVATLNSADLIVAGAYGHSRAREWVFGGVSYSFLHWPRRFVLLSH